ncbi:hypothetical protein KP78_11290 [Jeotgalibacillus soli]|uniref:Uncharacterized protein n=1 Tax=Jeotgalibacillus soli TaxID=889306 RepID=A0A0C2VZ49_9BACL|nr:hypothetical protein KP78_11290 [Jeotgalibacillus soli]
MLFKELMEKEEINHLLASEKLIFYTAQKGEWCIFFGKLQLI